MYPAVVPDTSCQKPKDAWDAFRDNFLKKQYFRTKMKEGTSVAAHSKHMKEITGKLASIVVLISEEEVVIVVILLGSLPQSYST